MMTRESTDPYNAFSNAVSGSTPVAEIVRGSRTEWWNPQDGAPYTLSYRTFMGPQDFTGPDPYTGPDFAWYLVDKSDPAVYTVYVYVTEV
jgi:hypothetical protein